MKFVSAQYDAYPQLLRTLEDDLARFKPERIVDVGGGDGAVSRFAASVTRGRVWCVDPAARRSGRKSRSRVVFVKARGERLPFANGFFDAALACFSLEYCDAPRALREARRATKPGAALFALFHHPRSFWVAEFKRARRTRAFAVPFFKRLSAGSALSSRAFGAFERRAALVNGVRFPPLALAPPAAVARFEKEAERSRFAGDWLAELYAALARLRVLLDAADSRAIAVVARRELAALEEDAARAPRRIFSPAQAKRLLGRAGFGVLKAETVLDDRGKPLASSVLAVARSARSARVARAAQAIL